MVERPDWPLLWLGLARTVSQRGTCSRKKVGAVLVGPNNTLISMGYNGNPRGIPHCEHDGTETHCETAVHAEVNAIASAARNGHSVEGSACYVTMAPCKPCAGVLINAGIKEVLYSESYVSRASGISLLSQAGVWVGQDARG